MSEFHVEVVRIPAVTKHPNADTLSVANIHGGYPVVFKTDEFKEGDLAVYVPVDALVPTDREPFKFLSERRIKARRFRGVFSMGLLVAAPPGVKEGQDVAQLLGVEKFVPKSEREPVPQKRQKLSVWQRILNWFRPKPPRLPYYDIEGLRRLPNLFKDGEEVVVTEKIHGCNARYVHDGKKFYVGSRTMFRSGENAWQKAADKYGLAPKLLALKGLALYGEIYGATCQDLDYSVGKDDIRFAAFDIYDVKRRCFLPYDEFKSVCSNLSIPMVPVLYRGPYSAALADLAEGKTTLPGADHVREGIVIVSTGNERKILKLPGQGYLLRKH